MEVSMEKMDVSIKKMDVLPLAKHYIDALKLYPIFQKHMPKPSNCDIEPAQVLCMMVANIVCESKPLYKVEDWASEYLDGLNEDHIIASKYNDDRLGRETDRLFNADRNSMMTEISANAIEVYSLELERIHNDSTSITFKGAYKGSDGSDGIHLTHGFNKDHRPDCKQIVFGLNITEDGHVPISYKIYNGNTTDDTTHVSNWNNLREFIAKEDFIYIADCKLCSESNLLHINDSGGFFITLVPKNRNEVKEFYEYIKEHDVEWETAYTIENSRKKGERVEYKIHEGLMSSDGYRIIWVHSSTKELQDKKRRDHLIEKVVRKLSEMKPKLNRNKLKTLDQIKSAIKKACGSCSEYLEIKITNEKKFIRKQEKPGRPGPNTKYIEIEEIKYSLDWKLNEDAISKAARKDGIFPLITNTEFEAAEVLRTYKKQPYLEKRMYTTKSVLEVAPVFLKLPRRIEAIMFLYFIALMIVSLIERNIRKNMADEDIESLAILPQRMRTKLPTWNNITYFFRNIYISTIRKDGKIIQADVKGLTEMHYRIMKLLEVPFGKYDGLIDIDDWCQFEHI